jgi:hypothetical protein
MFECKGCSQASFVAPGGVLESLGEIFYPFLVFTFIFSDDRLWVNRSDGDIDTDELYCATLCGFLSILNLSFV